MVWKEVLVGQTWALLGPFRLADGAGRLATVDDPRLKSAAGAKAFALGAASQGWATWFFAVPALALAGFGVCAGMLGLMIALVGRGLSLSFHGSVAALSLLRYITFATQYLLMLSAWNVLEPDPVDFLGVSPNCRGVVCGGVHPLSAELGVREAMAAWVFDAQLPGVVAATFALWLVNRVGSAALGLRWGGSTLAHNEDLLMAGWEPWAVVGAGLMAALHAWTLRGWSRAWRKALTSGNDVEPRAVDWTVVIPARNEAQHLGNVLDDLAAQDLQVQILVVDDHSTDVTASCLSSTRTTRTTARPHRRRDGQKIGAAHEDDLCKHPLGGDAGRRRPTSGPSWAWARVRPPE